MCGQGWETPGRESFWGQSSGQIFFKLSKLLWHVYESADYTQGGLGGNNNHHQLRSFSYVSLGEFLYVHKLMYSPQLPYKETEAGRGEVIVPGSTAPKWLSWDSIPINQNSFCSSFSEGRNRGVKRSMALKPPPICQPILCLFVSAASLDSLCSHSSNLHSS